MKNFLFAALTAICILAIPIGSPAQNKAKNKKSTAPGASRPVEERLKDLSTPGIEYPPTSTVFLYLGGEAPEFSNEITGPEWAEKGGFIAMVGDSARMDLYIPKTCNGQMVVICPGGGYHDLSSWNEGVYAAKWMNDRGIAACVLKYRLPNNGHTKVPLEDVQKAFRYCRSHASEWGVEQIGILGCSAGGHLASTAETQYADAETKPDFAILLYPVISMDKNIAHKRTRQELLGKEEDRDKGNFEDWYDRRESQKELEAKCSAFNNVTSSTPPTYIVLSSDDKIVKPENSLLMYEALVAAKVPVEMHIFPRGDHGWGFTTSDLGTDNLGYARSDFSSSLERWLENLRSPKAKGEKVKDKALAFRPDKTILLYPEGQHVDKGIVENGKAVTLGPGDANDAIGPEVCASGRRMSNVGDSASFELYLADPEKRSDELVVICPGGGYALSAQTNEGYYVAYWLAGQGVSSAVVKYRMPTGGHYTVPLTDIENTIRYCKAHAAEWGIKKIGVMGFSAGGHLAATASTLYADDSVRPDFSILFYPVISLDRKITHKGTRENLIGKHIEMADTYSLQNQVDSKTPPTIIFACSDDTVVPIANSLAYYRSLISNKVPAEMHIFPDGGHGWGFRTSEIGTDVIPEYRSDVLKSLARFLKEQQ